MRVAGLSVEQVDQLSDEFEALVTREMVRAAREAAQQLGASMEARAQTANVSQADVNVIFRLWEVAVRERLLTALEDVWLAGANHQQAGLAEAVEALTAAVALPGPDSDPGDVVPPPAPSIPNPYVHGLEAALAFLQTAFNRLVGIGNELWAAARVSLTEGMFLGESIPKLAARVRDAVGVATPRATVIARTEVISAANAGSIYAMRSTQGLVTHKVWLATFDGRTRPTHLAAHDQTVPLSGKFLLGAEDAEGGWRITAQLDHPGDPFGPAEEVINCRCSMDYEVNMERDALTAADVGPTTGMIALRPADPDEFTVEGGDPPEELHITMTFLGEVDEELHDSARKVAQRAAEAAPGPFTARVAGFGVLGAEDAVVLFLNGDGFEGIHAALASEDLAAPEQWAPWICHMTLGYGIDIELGRQFVGREFTVDALSVDVGENHDRFVLGGDATTLPAAVTREASVTSRAFQLEAQTARWRGVMVVEDTPTGDGRQFAADALTWPEMPLPLQWQKETSHGGFNDVTVTVGTIEKIEREGNQLIGEGLIDLGSEDGREVYRRISPQEQGGLGLGGVSIVADDPEQADVEYVYPAGCDLDEMSPEEIDDMPLDEINRCLNPILVIFHSGRIRALTVVDTPAFVEAKIEIVDEAEVTAAVALPVELRVGDKTIKLGQAVSEEDLAAFLREHAESVASSATEAFAEATDQPSTEEVTAEEQTSEEAGADDETVTAAADEEIPERLVAAAYTVTIPDLPPLDWYAEPTELPPIGAIKVTPEGRVYGLLGPSRTAHRGYANKRIEIPMGNVDYTRFMSRPTPVAMADGTTQEIPAGVVTMNCGHAKALPSVSADAALEHYDNSCSIVATIRIGENSQGVWVAGALMHGIEASDLARLLGCQLSGDWRPHPEKPGMRELTAALLVPVPGFASAGPTVRIENGELVAASSPIVFTDDTTVATYGQQLVDAYKGTAIDYEATDSAVDNPAPDNETAQVDGTEDTAADDPEALGGKPNKGTKKDRRLKENEAAAESLDVDAIHDGYVDDLPDFDEALRANDPAVQAEELAAELGLDIDSRLGELVASVKGES